MRNKNFNKRFVKKLLSVLLLILSSCSVTDTTANVTPTTAITIAPQTPSKTVALVPTGTVIVATRTSLPTLPAEEVQARALELLRTNAGCSLPCWWGIAPGYSTIDEARLIFEPFLGAIESENGFEYLESDNPYFMRSLASGLQVGVEVSAKDNLVSLVYVQTEMTKDIYNKVYDDPFYQEIMSLYTLETMLTKYGKPNQILVRSFSDLAGEFNPTQLLLYYPDSGIVVQYFSRNLPMLNNGTVTLWTCPPQSHISLRLFNPDSHMSLTQLLSIDDSYSKYKDISEVSNMDIDTFFQTYEEYDERAPDLSCPTFLKTPEDIWPNEYINP
jgi:hypothetical protein